MFHYLHLTKPINKKIIRIFIFILIPIIFSCNKNISCRIDSEHIYFNQGISNDFTIQLINVSKLDSTGIPVDYEETDVRTDFINETSKKIHTIYFFKKNDNGHWNYQFSEKYDAIPIKFEKRKWYLISSSDFKTGFFQNVNNWFFIYRDDYNKFHLFKSSQAISPI